MMLRHAAALALVGWYLMMPSPRMALARRADPSLTGWRQMGVYDSAAECNQMLGELRKQLKSRGQDELWAAERAQCIATDDPRLKESSK